MQKSDWEKWTQMDYNIKLFHHWQTPFDVELRKNLEFVVVEYEESDSSDWIPVMKSKYPSIL
jgi:hypothetical protein